jgi:hypothetical protein
MTKNRAIALLKTYAERPSKGHAGMVGGKVYSQTYKRPPRAWQANLHIDDRGGKGDYRAQVTIWQDDDGRAHIDVENRRDAGTGNRLQASQALLTWGQTLVDQIRVAAGTDLAPVESAYQRKARLAAEAQAQAQAELNDFLELLAEGGGGEE